MRRACVCMHLDRAPVAPSLPVAPALRGPWACVSLVGLHGGRALNAMGVQVGQRGEEGW